MKRPEIQKVRECLGCSTIFAPPQTTCPGCARHNEFSDLFQCGTCHRVLKEERCEVCAERDSTATKWPEAFPAPPSPPPAPSPSRSPLPAAAAPGGGSSNGSGLAVVTLACGIFSLMLCPCPCLGSFAGLAAVGLSLWSFSELANGRMDRRYQALVAIGGLCGVLGILSNCGLSMLVFLPLPKD